MRRKVKYTMNYDYSKLIDNAYQAKLRCEATNSKWGINFWNTVIKQLLRRANHQFYNIKQTITL